MNTITILVGQQQDGHTFMLEPKSRRLLRDRFPQVTVVKKVFISHETRQDLEAVHGDILNQVVSLLAGVSPQRLGKENIGVMFNDVMNDKNVSLPNSNAA